MDCSRCSKCMYRLIAMTERTGRTALVCLNCDAVDPMQTDAMKWARSGLATPLLQPALPSAVRDNVHPQSEGTALEKRR